MPPRIGIACQGGGSHAAFTAGVLAELFSPAYRDRFDLIALSGTSGGAVCAALAWSGLLARGPEEAAMRLEGFWADLAADGFAEIWMNAWTQLLLSLPFTANASPYAQVPTSETELRKLLDRWVKPGELPRDPAARIRPYFRVGVANVLEGRGAALDGESPLFSMDDIVASAAVPPLFRAVRARGVLRWDGLYAYNPPIGALLDVPDRPAEIWVIRLNPVTRDAEPRSFEEIEDRRNEMAGNLPLDAELDGVRLVNGLLAVAPVLGEQFGYRPVIVREVVLPLPELTYRSKLDRSAAHLRQLVSVGRAMAPFFFDDASITARPQG